MFRMSSAAAQQASMKAPSHKLSCFDLRHRQASTGRNPTQQKLKNLDPPQPMGQPNPWTTLIQTRTCCYTARIAVADSATSVISCTTEQRYIFQRAIDRNMSPNMGDLNPMYHMVPWAHASLPQWQLDRLGRLAGLRDRSHIINRTRGSRSRGRVTDFVILCYNRGGGYLSQCYIQSVK